MDMVARQWMRQRIWHIRQTEYWTGRSVFMWQIMTGTMHVWVRNGHFPFLPILFATFVWLRLRPNRCDGEDVRALKHLEFFFVIYLRYFSFPERKSHIFRSIWLHFGHTKSRYARRMPAWAEKITFSPHVSYVSLNIFLLCENRTNEKGISQMKKSESTQHRIFLSFSLVRPRTKLPRLASQLQDMGLFDCIALLSHASKQFHTLH